MSKKRAKNSVHLFVIFASVKKIIYFNLTIKVEEDCSVVLDN